MTRHGEAAGEGLFIDHVIYGVEDVDATAERLRREHGLGSVPGGIHLGGTSNRFVPLEPPTFLELLGVGDPSLADAAWLRRRIDGRDRMIWWVLGTADLDETARRRGLDIHSGTMPMAEGDSATFRAAGMHRYPLPFFVAHDPARVAVWRERYRRAEHECAPGAITFVEVGDAPEAADAWLGDHGLPVRHAPGEPGIAALGIATSRGEIVVR